MKIIGHRVVGWVKLVSDYAEITPQLYVTLDSKWTPVCIVEWVVIRVSGDNDILGMIVDALAKEMVDEGYLLEAEIDIFKKHLKLEVLTITGAIVV